MDRALGGLAARLRIFPDGWGDPRVLQGLSRAPLPALPDAPVVHWTGEAILGSARVLDGWFDSPAAVGPLPTAAHRAYFQLHLPTSTGNRPTTSGGSASNGASSGAPESSGDRPPLVILLSALGRLDLGWRSAIASLLVERGLGALVLEQAFEGRRRAPTQKGPLPRTVTEFLLQSRATVVEASALVAWAAGRGHGKVALSGLGIGATLAATVAASAPLEVAMVGLGPAEGIGPFLLEGVLGRALDYGALGGTARDTQAAARQRLAEVLAASSLLQVSAPARPRRAIFIAAREDGVVNSASTLRLLQHWRGAELRWVPRGHVAAALSERQTVVRALIEALDRVAPVLRTESAPSAAGSPRGS